MPFRRRYKNRDTTDEGGSGSRGYSFGYRRGGRGGVPSGGGFGGRDTTDEGGSGSRRRRRGWPPGWGKYQGAGGGLKDLVDFLRDFREWRAQKYDRADNREYRKR